MARGVTEIRVNERGDETHESWLLISASRGSSTGTFMFDSELPHRTVISVLITRCSRRRDLKHDWLYREERLLEFDVSQAQWGAFVSSFGDGSGVPATLRYLVGEGVVPAAPRESRLARSHAEVRGAADEALSKVQAAFDRVESLYEAKAGRRELGAAMRDLHFALRHAPSNMEFAAKALTEHSENVVTKARADIEAMARAAVAEGRELSATSRPELGTGEDDES